MQAPWDFFLFLAKNTSELGVLPKDMFGYHPYQILASWIHSHEELSIPSDIPCYVLQSNEALLENLRFVCFCKWAM